jgi:pyruvate/2-oxoglutarate dehydrogenase complex dihydrolipoamide acyltransferase (E2) component
MNGQTEKTMLAVTVNEGLWAASMAPEGVLERWRARDSETITAGQALAEVRIEGALHEILAPGPGKLIQSLRAGELVQPGDRLGWVEDNATAS